VANFGQIKNIWNSSSNIKRFS